MSTEDNQSPGEALIELSEGRLRLLNKLEQETVEAISFMNSSEVAALLNGIVASEQRTLAILQAMEQVAQQRSEQQHNWRRRRPGG